MTFDFSTLPSKAGTIAIVTGANTGLGYETALGLALTGMKVIMACRSQERAATAQAKILAQVPQADLEILPLDLAKLSSVRAFAEAYRRQFSRLDLLINNAGIMFPPYSKTEDGFESQLGVNHLGHFLLTALLLDQMPDQPESRVVSLSSNAHKFGTINFEDLQSEQQYSRTAAYGQSKLACLLFAHQLHHKLVANGRQLLSVCAHPGGAETELSRHIPKAIYWPLKFSGLSLLTHSPAAGAQPTLYAALAPDVKGGEYFGPQGLFEMSGKPGRVSPSAAATDQQVGQRLWDVSLTLTGVEPFC